MSDVFVFGIGVSYMGSFDMNTEQVVIARKQINKDICNASPLVCQVDITRLNPEYNIRDCRNHGQCRNWGLSSVRSSFRRSPSIGSDRFLISFDVDKGSATVRK